jgi:disulfide oxidoreductase YuzD
VKKRQRMSAKYIDIFNDHFRIAKEKFIEENKREPTFYELLEFYNELFDHFYD